MQAQYYGKNKTACICSWFCHEMTLPNVWYCFLYKKKKQNTRLWMLYDSAISQSFFWTTFCTFEHYRIACLAAVSTIWKRDLMWIKISPLLFCFLFTTQALVCIILVCWMYDYKCIVSNYILSSAEWAGYCASPCFLFYYFCLHAFQGSLKNNFLDYCNKHLRYSSLQ